MGGADDRAYALGTPEYLEARELCEFDSAGRRPFHARRLAAPASDRAFSAADEQAAVDPGGARMATDLEIFCGEPGRNRVMIVLARD